MKQNTRIPGVNAYDKLKFATTDEWNSVIGGTQVPVTLTGVWLG